MGPRHYFMMAALALGIVSTGCENNYQAQQLQQLQQLKLYQDSLKILKENRARVQRRCKSCRRAYERVMKEASIKNK